MLVKIYNYTFSFLLYVSVFILFVSLIISGISVNWDMKRISVFGYRPVITITGSMLDTIPINALSLVKIVKSIDDVEVKDVVVYENTITGEAVIHRVIKKNLDSIITQGDANEYQDFFEASSSELISKVLYTSKDSAKYVTSLFGEDILNIPESRLIKAMFIITVILILFTFGLDWVITFLLINLFCTIYTSDLATQLARLTDSGYSPKDILTVISIKNYKFSLWYIWMRFKVVESLGSKRENSNLSSYLMQKLLSNTKNTTENIK